MLCARCTHDLSCTHIVRVRLCGHSLHTPKTLRTPIGPEQLPSEWVAVTLSRSASSQ